jgi:protein SCO1/2
MRVDTECGAYPRASVPKSQLGRLGPRRVMTLLVLGLVLSAWAGSTALAQGGLYGGPPEQSSRENELPVGLREVGIDQKLDGQLPLDLTFRDEGGREVRIEEYFRGRPVILAPVYYECPMLCNQVLNGLTESLKAVSLDAGDEFEVIAVSFDPRETPSLAAAKKESYVRRYGRMGADAGWHFLTGDKESIARLTDAVGFRYRWDAATNQFAHASAVMVLTPRGKISRYFYGIDYAPSDLRLGLVEASEGKVGSPVDQLLLYCFHYDPVTGKYGAAVMNVMKLFSVVFLVVVGALFVLLRRRNARRAATATAAG